MKREMTNSRLRSRMAMTLMETMMALFILAAGMTGAISLVMASMRQSGQAQMHYVAANIAKARIERARVSAFSSLPSLEEVNTRVDAVGSPDWSGQYRRTTEVTDVSPNLRQVSVFVEVLDKMDQVFGGDSGYLGSDGFTKSQENMTSLFADFQVPTE